MRGFHQILVPWTTKKNDWVLEKAGAKKSLLVTVKTRMLRYFGHAMRKSGDCLEKDVIQGTLPGKRRKGKSKTSWNGNVDRAW